MNKILAVVWFFGFWGMTILEQTLLGECPVSTEWSGLVAGIFLGLWFIPPVLLYRSK